MENQNIETNRINDKKIWYLCDGRDDKCEKSCCYMGFKEDYDYMRCRYTQDIKHAVNFQERKGRFTELKDRTANTKQIIEVKYSQPVKEVYNKPKSTKYEVLCTIVQIIVSVATSVITVLLATELLGW